MLRKHQNKPFLNKIVVKSVIFNRNRYKITFFWKKNTKSRSRLNSPKNMKISYFSSKSWNRSYFCQNRFLKQIDRYRDKTYSEILQNLRGLAQSGHFWSFLVATSSVTIKVSKLKSEYVLRSSKVVNFLRVVLVVQFQINITWFYMFLIF